MKRLGWATAIALLLGIVLGLMFSGRNDVTAAPNVVNTFNTRSGNVTLTSSDITSALTFAPANQADLTATNTNLTDNYFTKSASDSRFALFGSSYTKTESDAKYAASGQVVNTFNTRSGNVTLTSSDVTTALTFAPANQADLTATNTNLADNYFTKSASDSRFALLGSSYTKTESDAKYAVSGQVVTSLNNLTGGVTLNAGSNITITPSGNTLTIGASTSLSQPLINPLRVATLRWYNGNDTGAGLSFGQPAVSLAFDGAHMWATAGISLIKFRPSDCAILGSFSTQAGGTAGSLIFDGANLWVAISDNPLILKFRASDGALIATFSLSAIAQELAFNGFNIWVATGTKLLRIRANDGVIEHVFELGTPIQGLAIDDSSYVWATLSNGTVAKVQEIDDPIVTYSVGTNPIGIAFDGANMWIANSGNKFVTKLRASDGAFLGNFNIPVNIGNPSRIAFDGANMWVTTSGGRVERFPVSNGIPGRSFSAGTNPGGIAFDGANIWVAHSSGVNKL